MSNEHANALLILATPLYVAGAGRLAELAIRYGLPMTRTAYTRRRGDRMKRREFITLVGGAVASPLVAHAQQIRDMRTVGVIMSSAENDTESQTRIAAFCGSQDTRVSRPGPQTC
jgi:hypothetical protein